MHKCTIVLVFMAVLMVYQYRISEIYRYTEEDTVTLQCLCFQF